MRNFITPAHFDCKNNSRKTKNLVIFIFLCVNAASGLSKNEKRLLIKILNTIHIMVQGVVI
jgi:hypothetical protein